ncbi:MAG: cupin domain-containing protein [Pseudomonadota bacterium]
MELNADFDQRAVVHAGKEEWIPSPMKGVDRRMLDRIGDEVARATTIVRYAPGSHFSAHTHTGGEEYLVLEGVFQDEHGDFPAGTYVRNPPTTSHTPSSDEGCTIFVKLWQFDMEDRHQMSIDTNAAEWSEDPGRQGVRKLELYKDDREHVSMEEWAAGTSIGLDATQGMEVLVMEGSFEENGETFENQSWLRLPKGSSSVVTAGDEGCKVWIKRNHLKEKQTAPAS